MIEVDLSSEIFSEDSTILSSVNEDTKLTISSSKDIYISRLSSFNLTINLYILLFSLV